MILNHVDLFSGIGGFSLGLEATGGFRTTAFCEIDPFCQRILRKHWPDVPLHTDVRDFEHDGTIHILTGGYPCQPFSTAGKRKGDTDPRHLWPAMFGIIERHQPRWIIGENVIGHISMGLDEVLADLERAAYRAIPFVIPACAVGAPHIRERIWIVATNAAGPISESTWRQSAGQQEFANGDSGYADANTEIQRLQGQRFGETGGGAHERISTRRGLAGVYDAPCYGNRGGGTTGDKQPNQASGVKLNPQFVEWMMGYPKNWTKPPAK